MNEIPSELYVQPLSVGLVMEEYDNIIVGKYYYAHRHVFDPSGNLIFSQDYFLVVVEKDSGSIEVSVKSMRFADSGPEWIPNTTGENDVLTYARSECTAGSGSTDYLSFWRPLLEEIAPVPVSDTDTENTVSTEDPPTVTVQ
jgi:hypothetical protein